MAMTMATMMMAVVRAAMLRIMMGDDDDNDSGGAAADGMVWGRHQATGGNRNGNKAEMGTMWV